MAYIIVTTALFVALVIIRIAIGNTSGMAKIDFGSYQTAGNRQVNADMVDWAYYDDQLLLVVADGIGAGDKAVTAPEVAVRIITRLFEHSGVGGNPAYYFMNSFKSTNSTVLRYIPDSVVCQKCEKWIRPPPMAGGARFTFTFLDHDPRFNCWSKPFGCSIQR